MIRQFLLLLSSFFISINVLTGQTNGNQQRLYTKDELSADLQYLKNQLENNHPGLYLYSSKTVIDKMFDSLLSSISQPFTDLEFYKHLTVISAIIKDGHTIILPGQKTTDYHGANSKFLPYHFAIMDGRLYIDMVYTADKSIMEGAKIISINNVEASDLVRQLSERQVRDGENKTYPVWILNNYFRQYYNFIFGHPESYVIMIEMNGLTTTATVNGLSRDSINYYRQKNYPGKTFSNLPNEGIQLKLEKNYALLTIKDFHDDILRKDYKQNFEKVIANYFEQINNSKTENLILDLRNNQGGDIKNGVFLLSYLLDRPFSVVQEYFCVDNKQLQHCKGPALGMHEPAANNFKGGLYVLINGGSFSNSGIVSSCLQANKRAVFIGEETGGNPNVINGFIKDISLPNTGVQVQIPTRQFVITSKNSNNGRGVMPEKSVTPTIADILEGKDPALIFTIGKISNAANSR